MLNLSVAREEGLDEDAALAPELLNYPARSAPEKRRRTGGPESIRH
jgi:hypothetical protein